MEILKNLIGLETKNTSPSPFGRWLNPVLKEVFDDGILCHFVVREEMTNPVGILHGGVMAGLIDELIGVSVFGMQLDAFYASISLNVEFLKAAKVNELIQARTFLIRKGRNLISMECKLYNESGDLLAKASSALLKSSF